MGVLLRSSVAAVVFGLVIYWCVDAPLPDDVQQKWKVLAIDACMRMYGRWSALMAAVGLGGPTSDFQRWIGDKYFIALTTGWPRVVRDDPALKIQDLYTPNNKIMLRMYEPRSTIHQTKRPVLMFFHGGGFSFLSVDAMDHFTRRIARDSGMLVISVEYRLSPQHPFPTPLNDCIEAVKHVIESAETLRIDPERIAVSGQSAGGNLAASVSLRMRTLIKLQVLIAPALQFFTYNTSSVTENKEYCQASSNSLFQIAGWLNYIGCCQAYLPFIMSGTHTSVHLKQSKYGDFVNQEKWMEKTHMSENTRHLDLSQPANYGRNDLSRDFIDKMTNPQICPLMADEELLIDLPRAYMMTFGHDIIRDEGIMYASRLKAAGVPIHLSNYRSAFHNDMFFTGGLFRLDIADVIARDLVEYIQLHL